MSILEVGELGGITDDGLTPGGAFSVHTGATEHCNPSSGPDEPIDESTLEYEN
jgi:hypothetical protein